MSVDINRDNTERLLEYNVKVQNQVQHSTPNGCREYQVPMFLYQQIEHATTGLRGGRANTSHLLEEKYFRLHFI